MKHIKKFSKYKNIRVIRVQDWDKLVSDVYGKPYSFQQQDGCQPRGTFNLSIPSDDTFDDEMNDEIPEVSTTRTMGVKFEKWLERDPKKPLNGDSESWKINLWWERKFYPDINTLANDLYKKGLIDEGEYLIEIDW